MKKPVSSFNDYEEVWGEAVVVVGDSCELTSEASGKYEKLRIGISESNVNNG